MIVCHCHSITDRDLKRAASSPSGAGLPAPVQRAGTCCGSCKPIVRKLLESYHAKAQAEAESGK